MAETKTVTVFRAGGTASVEQVVLIPGQTPQQLIYSVAPQLGLASGGRYELLGPDNKPITGDIYNAVKEGDKLTIVPIGEGGTR